MIQIRNNKNIRIVLYHDLMLVGYSSIYVYIITVLHKCSLFCYFQCIQEVQLSSLHGRKIAIDASMAIYQFLIAVRSGGPNQANAMLTNAEGETTSHIQVI